MTQQVIIDYWIDKARSDLDSAMDNFNSGRYANAIRDAYFAWFEGVKSPLDSIVFT